MFLKDVLDRVWMAAAERGFCDSSENVKGLESPRKEEVLPIITEEFTERIARACHEVNRIYCSSIGDYSPPFWDAAPPWQQASTINGVIFHLGSPQATPEDSHKFWLSEKQADGWIYGPVKDPLHKEHPCMVAYDRLPASMRVKDCLFAAIVKSFT
jgi:hypothetical protein